MNNFEFYNPTKIHFGKGSIAKITEEIPLDARILITYGGGSIKKNGVYDQVISALENRTFFEFSNIQPNPDYHHLLQALSIIKEKNIDYLLAVGGGSVIDATKFLSSASFSDVENKWDILKKGIRTFKGMPFGAVLTLPATGSEMNSGAVVSNRETGEKLGMGGPGLFPQFSILDPEVVKTLPERQIANGVVDAFTHVLEQYVTYPADGYLQDRFAESILATLLEVGPKVIKDPSDYALASNFMWSCTMALNGLIQKGVPTDWAIHAMGHELTALYNIDHARTLAIIMGSHYRFNLDSKKEKLAQLGKRVFGVNENDVTSAARQTIEKMESFMNSLGVDTKLSRYVDDFEGTAEKVSNNLENRGWVAIGEHKSLNPDHVKAIVEMSY